MNNLMECCYSILNNLNYKKYYFLFFLQLFLSLEIRCQVKDNKKDNYRKFSIELLYGSNVYIRKEYNLNSIERVNLNYPTRYLGIQSSSIRYSYAPRYSLGNFAFFKLLKDKVSINDSINVHSTGFGFSKDYLQYDILGKRYKNQELDFCLGFKTGRIVFSNNDVNQKNSYFSPLLGLFYLLKIKHISIYSNFNYSKDISKGNWVSINKPLSPIIKSFNQDCFSFSIGLGWVFYWKK